MANTKEFHFTEGELVLLHNFTISGVEGLQVAVTGMKSLLKDEDKELSDREGVEQALEDGIEALKIGFALLGKFNPEIDKMMKAHGEDIIPPADFENKNDGQ